MKQKKTGNRWKISDKIAFGILLVSSVIFAFLVQKVLPFKFWIIFAGVLAIMNLILFYKLWSMNKKAGKILQKEGTGIKNPYTGKKRRTKAVCVFLSVLLIIGSLAAGKGLGTLDEIAGEKYQTQLITVLVQTDSSYEKLKDLDGKKLGYVSAPDVEKALTEIESGEKVSFEKKVQGTVLDLAKAILDSQVEAIILNEAYRGLIEDEYGSFPSKTRVIYEYEEKQLLQREEADIKVTKNSFNVFISGIDTYGKVSTVSRSDVNMIVTVNPKTKQILMTSIPRDYYVELASFGAMDKLTHAGIYGVSESMATLEKEFGITIHYYAKVNFSSLVKIVNALGGISVYNDQSFTSFHTQEYYPKGEIYMDGATALEFVRERYGLANGDHDRVKNQAKVLKAMINKAISPAIITNFGDILDAVSGSVATSMESKDIQAMLQMQINDMAAWDIQQVSITGTGTTSSNCYSMPGLRTYVMKPNMDSVNKAVVKINEVMSAK